MKDKVAAAGVVLLGILLLVSGLHSILKLRVIFRNNVIDFMLFWHAFIMMVVFFVSGFGILKRKKWAKNVVLIVGGLIIFSQLLNLWWLFFVKDGQAYLRLRTSEFSMMGTMTQEAARVWYLKKLIIESIICPAAIVVFLLIPPIRKQFY